MRFLTGSGKSSALAAAVLAALATVTPAAAHADPGAVVYPGMEIRQGAIMCTLGFVDTAQRVAYSAGHCRAPGPVTDISGRTIGFTTASSNNIAPGSIVMTDQVVSDYQEIALVPEVEITNILPSGRALESSPGGGLAAGAPVCHFGIVTGESCGTVEQINNGWFTMANGVVSQKGDSGGPVYTLDGDRAVIVGLFNSTWGVYPAAVSWPV